MNRHQIRGPVEGDHELLNGKSKTPTSCHFLSPFADCDLSPDRLSILLVNVHINRHVATMPMTVIGSDKLPETRRVRVAAMGARASISEGSSGDQIRGAMLTGLSFNDDQSRAISYPNVQRPTPIPDFPAQTKPSREHQTDAQSSGVHPVDTPMSPRPRKRVSSSCAP